MTDLPQNDFDPLRKKVYALADSLLSNAITSEEAKSLGELVCNDAEARRHYVRFMHDSAVLHQWSSRISVAEESYDAADRPRETSSCSRPLSPEPVSVAFPGIVIDPSPTVLPLVFSLNSPLGGMLFSYLMSALLVCLGMLIGLMCNVSEPLQVVNARSAYDHVA